MSTTPITKEQDQFICDWFDNLDADYIFQLQELNDDYDLTPRRAYHLVFGDLSGVCTCKACLLPGRQDLGASLAAPAKVGQVEGTPLPRLLRSPVGAWVHLHKRPYFVAYLTCGAATRQGVLSSERRK